MDANPTQNCSNAHIFNEVSLQLIKVEMIRYETIFDFYSEEPNSFRIKLDKDDPWSEYEQVFRIRNWMNDEICYSWIIYAKEREFVNDTAQYVIRKVIWDRKKDCDLVRESCNLDREMLLNRWPAIYTNNVLLEVEQSQRLAAQMIKLDQMIECGIYLTPEGNPNWDYRDLEIKRHYDWGQIHITWSPTHNNRILEGSINQLEGFFQGLLTEKSREVFSMQLNYSMRPEDYKHLIFTSSF